MKKAISKPIEIEKAGGVAVIRFTRPEIKNPLSVETLEIVSGEFETLENDNSIDGVIFTGSGNTFAAGANLSEVMLLTSETARDFGLRGQNLMKRIYLSPKPTIAAIDGYCMGGGLDLALACDSRIASPRSVFAHPGVKLGIITGWGGTQFLPRLIGEKMALEILLTGRNVDSSEALEIGLIDEISKNPLETSVSSLSEKYS